MLQVVCFGYKILAVMRLAVMQKVVLLLLLGADIQCSYEQTPDLPNPSCSLLQYRATGHGHCYCTSSLLH